MAIPKSTEDYLEAMLMLKEEHGYIRSVDVANQLGVTKPSVSYATKRLRKNGYIITDSDNLITLTEPGMAIASNIYRRHLLLTEFLTKLGVDEATARDDACKIEHDISTESFDAICSHAAKMSGLLQDSLHNTIKEEEYSPEEPLSTGISSQVKTQSHKRQAARQAHHRRPSAEK